MESNVIDEPSILTLDGLGSPANRAWSGILTTRLKLFAGTVPTLEIVHTSVVMPSDTTGSQRSANDTRNPDS